MSWPGNQTLERKNKTFLKGRNLIWLKKIIAEIKQEEAVYLSGTLHRLS